MSVRWGGPRLTPSGPPPTATLPRLPSSDPGHSQLRRVWGSFTLVGLNGERPLDRMFVGSPHGIDASITLHRPHER